MRPESIVDSPFGAVAAAPFVHLSGHGSAVSVLGHATYALGTRVAAGADGIADGAYASWSWDGRQLHIDHDPFGLMPLYEWRTATSIALATSPLKLLELGAPADLDGEALAVFLRMGFMPGDDTAFACIKAVAPGRTSWRMGQPRAATPIDHPAQHSLTRGAAIDAFIDLFRDSVRRRLPPGDCIIPLSGGRDSRHILFELRHQGVRPRFCATIGRYPPTPAEDPRVAEAVAQAVGVPHRLLAQSPSRFESEHRKNWATGLCADEHAWFVAMVDQLEPEGATLYDGLGGSLSVASRFVSPEHLRLVREGQFRPLAERLLRLSAIYTEDVIRRASPPHDPGFFSWERAVSRVALEIARHADAPDPFRSFHFWTRLRRELALVPCGMMAAFPAVHLPLMDRGLVRMLASLPPETISTVQSQSDKSFHSDAIQRAYPAFAHVPFEDKHAPRADAAGINARFARETARYLLARYRRPSGVSASAYFRPRLVAALLHRRFAASRPWLPALALYLFQLDSATRAGA